MIIAGDDRPGNNSFHSLFHWKTYKGKRNGIQMLAIYLERDKVREEV